MHYPNPVEGFIAYPKRNTRKGLQQLKVGPSFIELLSRLLQPIDGLLSPSEV